MSRLGWAAVLASALGLGLALAALGRRSTPRFGALAAAAALAALAGLGLSFAALQETAHLLASPWEIPDPSARPRGAMLLVARRSEVATLAAAALGALTSAVLAGVVTSRRPHGALAATAAALFTVALVGVAARSAGVVARPPSAEHREPSRALARARALVLAAAGLGAALTLARARRAPLAGRGAGAWVGALAVFGGGLGSFWATRAFAADARLRAPAADELPLAADLPPSALATVEGSAPAGDPCRRGPLLLLQVTDHLVRLDGHPTPDPDELAARIAEAPAGPVLVLAAPHDLPLARAAPYLAAARRGRGGDVGLLVARPPEVLQTATLGEVSRSLVTCWLPARLDPAGRAFSPTATWRDVVAAARASSSPLLLHAR